MPTDTPKPPHPQARPTGSIRLSDVAPGRSVVVESVDISHPGGRRLLDLGFLPKTVIRVVRRAPLGDPIAFYLRGSQMCLRRSEAGRIRVNELEVSGTS